jgi:Complex I intermediate-associated protein 30 (CIA30)
MRTRNLDLVVLFLSHAFHEVVVSFPLLSTGGVSKKGNVIGSVKAERQPWNAFRFIQQSSKFVSLPFSQPQMVDRVISPGELLWSPGQSSNGFRFGPLDDVVMGGVSSSAFDDSTGIWSGKVTDANNGGFIGIRSYPSFQWDMTKCRGVQLKVKCSSTSDARIKIGLRDSAEFNGIVWNSSFDVTNKVRTVKVPFSSLIPNRFANRMKTDAPFKQENVVGVQLVFSKFEYDGALNPRFRVGDFSLQVLEIFSY